MQVEKGYKNTSKFPLLALPLRVAARRMVFISLLYCEMSTRPFPLADCTVGVGDYKNGKSSERNVVIQFCLWIDLSLPLAKNEKKTEVLSGSDRRETRN